jgi:hypothetical protein
MNSDRITQLARQAYMQACAELQQTDIARWYSDRGPPSELVNQKFAELIIRECAQLVNQNDHDSSTLGDRLLFEHFGIQS